MTENVLALREALEPCPFCGGRPVTACLNDDGDRWVVRCISCGAEGGWGKTATSAERYWSMRTPAAVRAETLAGPAAVERVAALEGALDELMNLRTEHGINCYVTDEVGCVCGLDQALEHITDVRLAATPPTPAPTAARLAEALNALFVKNAIAFGVKDPETGDIVLLHAEPTATAILAALATSPAPAAEVEG